MKVNGNVLKQTSLFAAVALVVFLLAGCQFINDLLGNGTGFDLSVTQATDGTTVIKASGSSPFSFGPVDPTSTTGRTLTFTVVNNTKQDVTISKISSDDATDYTFTVTNSSIAAGQSTTCTGIFHPTTNGTKAATVTITGSVGSSSGTATFEVTGDGNSPPVITFAVKVTLSANNDAYNGTYMWDDTQQAFANNGYFIYPDYPSEYSG